MIVVLIGADFSGDINFKYHKIKFPTICFNFYVKALKDPTYNNILFQERSYIIFY